MRENSRKRDVINFQICLAINYVKKKNKEKI